VINATSVKLLKMIKGMGASWTEYTYRCIITCVLDR